MSAPDVTALRSATEPVAELPDVEMLRVDAHVLPLAADAASPAEAMVCAHAPATAVLTGPAPAQTEALALGTSLALGEADTTRQ